MVTAIYDGVSVLVREALASVAPVDRDGSVVFSSSLPATLPPEPVLTVVLLDPWCPDAAAMALAGGAVPISPALGAAQVWGRTMDAIDGWVALPRLMACTLVQKASQSASVPIALRKDDIAFLEGLAAGYTIRQIAREGPYSERTLRRWYARLRISFQVQSREALVSAYL